MKKLRIKIHSESHNRAVQERLFELGYGWSGEKKFKYPMTDQINAYKYGGLAHGTGLGTKKPTHTLDDLYAMETLESIKSKKGLEAGNWYKCTTSKWVAYYSGDKDSCPYGWDFEGKWDTDLWFQYPENLVKATYEEVLDRFRKEFKDRGFIDGCSYRSVYKHGDSTYCSTQKYNSSLLTLGTKGNSDADIFSDGMSVFYRGTFATPILDELPEIAGYRGKFTETGVKYGCTEVKFDFIMDDAFDYVTTMYTQTGSSVFHDDLKLVKKAVSNHLNHKIDHERHI